MECHDLFEQRRGNSVYSTFDSPGGQVPGSVIRKRAEAEVSELPDPFKAIKSSLSCDQVPTNTHCSLFYANSKPAFFRPALRMLESYFRCVLFPVFTAVALEGWRFVLSQVHTQGWERCPGRGSRFWPCGDIWWTYRAPQLFGPKTFCSVVIDMVLIWWRFTAFRLG